MPRLWNRAAPLLIAAVTLILDQGTKALVVRFLQPTESWSPSPQVAHWLRITYVSNTGAAFGLLQNQNLIFAAIAVVVSIAILFYYRRVPDGMWLVRLALGLQLGGALGNLADRLRYGYVVDFVDVNFAPLRDLPVFNVADASIVLGVCLLAFAMLREESRARPEHLPDV